MAESAVEETFVGSCRGCGYSLRGLEAIGRCPECGRGFDLSDPKTFTLGRRPGRLARWLNRPSGWPSMVVLLAGTAAIVYATRPPLGSIGQWKPSGLDLPIYLNWIVHPDQHGLQTSTDLAYAGGLIAWCLTAGWFIARILIRVLLQQWHGDNAEPLPPVRGRRLGFEALLLLLVAGCVLVGWPFRLAQHVAEIQARSDSIGEPVFGESLAKSSAIAGIEFRLEICRHALMRSRTPAQRLAGLKIAIAAMEDADLLSAILEAIKSEEDPAVVAEEIRVLGMGFGLQIVDQLDAWLTDPRPEVRTAAVDAVRLIASPEFNEWLYARYDPPGVRLNDLARMLDNRIRRESVTPEGIVLDGDARFLHANQHHSRIVQIMADGLTGEERQSAADALPNLRTEQHSRFRLAEWGVWVDSSQANGIELSPAMRELGQIPPFVHWPGGSAAWMVNQTVDPPLAVFKPVVQFQVDQPTSIQLTVLVDGGRVAAVYPKPDEPAVWPDGGAAFFVQIPHAPSLGVLDPPTSVAPFDRRFLFPWTKPADSTPPRGPLSPVSALGYRWKSLIVLPARASWMQPPVVPNDPAFGWWTRLREVPAAWVSSRGESERFLYYDGPSLFPPVVRVRQGEAAGTLLVTIEPDIFSKLPESPKEGGMRFKGLIQSARKDRPDDRRGIHIEVSPSHQVSAEIVPITHSGEKREETMHRLGTGERLTGPNVESKLRDWILDAGLTAAEADGMLAAWHESFFVKPGRRFVVLMSAGDYDTFCPMQIDPTPTESARVGLIWTELSGK